MVVEKNKKHYKKALRPSWILCPLVASAVNRIKGQSVNGNPYMASTHWGDINIHEPDFYKVSPYFSFPGYRLLRFRYCDTPSCNMLV